MNREAIFSVLTATGRPQARAAAGTRSPAEDSSAKQFSTDLLNALMNCAAGASGGSVRLANLAAGQSPLICETRETADGPHAYIFDGVPGSEPADAESAEERARNLIRSLGSGGTLSLTEVEAAMGIGDAACDARDLMAIRSAIRTNWGKLSGGAEAMTVAQMTASIERCQREV